MNIHSIGFNSVYGRNYSYRNFVGKGEYMLVSSRNRIKFGDVEYPENTVILYGEETEADYSSAGNFLLCDWICFDTEGDSDFLDSLEIVINKPLRFADTEFITGIIGSISAEYYSVKSRRVKMIDLLMKTLLMKISDITENRENLQQTSELHYSELMELREKIYRNPQLKWNVDTMASYVSMSRSYFQHIYSEVFGVSCMTDVINSKIEKAKEILSETSCTVSQVATMCGYDNEEHFMRQFKRIVGTTPTGYRRKN